MRWHIVFVVYEVSEIKIRCRSCHQRFSVQKMEEIVQCATCGQKWRLKWFDESSATIIGPLSWVEFQTKMRRLNK